MPPREPGRPGTYAQGTRGAGAWQAGRPSQAGPMGPTGPTGPMGPGGWRPGQRTAAPAGSGPAAPPGPPAGPPDPSGPVDGGYAYVIRASDYPVPPAAPPRPQNQARPVGEDPANVYVYRDGGGQQAGPAEPDESDAAYWYGRREEEDQPAVQPEVRGPFEPLLPSTAPPPDPESADAMRPDTVLSDTLPPGTGSPDTVLADIRPRGDGPEDPAHAQARKLEQIKDFYLTAEAIGEENVDKHFDQLLAHQRELIGEYFRQSTAAKLGGTPESAPEAQPARPEVVQDEPARPPAARTGPPEAVVGEKPRA
jgi:hypothetical protein